MNLGALAERALRTRDVALLTFLVMEAFGWYVALQAVGTGMVRDGFEVLASRIALGADTADADPDLIRRAYAIAQEQSDSALGGPPFIAIALGAFGAFLLVRWIIAQRLPTPIAAATGVAASLIAFHVLLHISVVRDFRVWETAGLAELLGAGNSAFAERISAAAFIADPDPARVQREAVTVSVAGLTALWLRFAILGRSPFSYERVLRSFGAWFGILLAIAFAMNFWRQVDVLGHILAFTVLGVLALSVAHGAREQELEGRQRAAPWLASLAFTVGMLAAIALIFGLLSFADAGQLFEPVIDGAFWLLGRALFLVIYPFAWVMQVIMEFLLGGRTLELDRFVENLQNLEPPQLDPREDPLFPPWVSTAIRAAALFLLGYVLYRLGRILFARKRTNAVLAAATEFRTVADADTEGGLLRSLFRRRASQAAFGAGWLRQHEVYRLFARVVQGAEARGYPRPQDRTALEFAHDAGTEFGAPMYEPIARAFDEARYGRHFPADGSLDTLARELDTWETAHPPLGPRQRDGMSTAPREAEPPPPPDFNQV